MIAFQFLQDLYSYTKGWTLADWGRLYEKSLERLQYGFTTYHKPMTAGDGQNTPEEAWQEAFDLCQYLLKCHQEGRGDVYKQMYNDTLEILLELETQIGKSQARA